MTSSFCKNVSITNSQPQVQVALTMRAGQGTGGYWCLVWEMEPYGPPPPPPQPPRHPHHQPTSTPYQAQCPCMWCTSLAQCTQKCIPSAMRLHPTRVHLRVHPRVHRRVHERTAVQTLCTRVSLCNSTRPDCPGALCQLRPCTQMSSGLYLISGRSWHNHQRCKNRNHLDTLYCVIQISLCKIKCCQRIQEVFTSVQLAQCG